MSVYFDIIWRNSGLEARSSQCAARRPGVGEADGQVWCSSSRPAREGLKPKSSPLRQLSMELDELGGRSLSPWR